MKRKIQKDRKKPHFCCDQNLQYKTLNKKCNRYGVYKTSKSLLKNEKAEDAAIIQFCVKRDFHIITHNKENFKDYAQRTKVGIIYIGSQDPKFWLYKFISFMKTHPNHEDLYYLNVSIEAGDIYVMDRR